MERKIRAVVVDDSALMRQMISRILEEGGIEVVAAARDGWDGLAKIISLQPDVVTLDVEMPRMDGLAMLRRLMKTRPTPVVMLSSLTASQAPAAVEALAIGAVDVVGKPGGGISLNLDQVAEELLRKVQVAATASVQGTGSFRSQNPAQEDRTAPLGRSKAARSGSTDEVLVVVGSSTGGPRALTELVSRLPDSFPAPIVIVQHMPAGFTVSLASRLNEVSPLAAAEAEDGRVPRPGEIWVAPGGVHLVFDSRRRMKFDESPPHLGVRPAVDFTLESAVDRWEGGVVGVILTGMGKDGARGSRRVKQAGGTVLAQDEATCVVYGMPRTVVEMGLADRVAGIHEMGNLLEEIVGKKARDVRGQPRWRGDGT